MSDKPARNRALAFREIADEGGLVVDPRHSRVEVLNPVGAKVYAMLDGEHSVEQIVAAVVEEFEVDEATARADIEAFLGDLREREMLKGDSANPRV